MLSKEQIDFFNREGYLLIPGILSQAEVAELRKKILDIFESGKWKESEFNTNRVLSDVYNQFPELVEKIITKETIAAVSDLLGDQPVLLPETAIHYQLYSGWHKDTSYQEKDGQSFHLKPGSLLVEAGIYLQDNNEYGGGLTVMPGSHKTPDNFIQPRETPSIIARVKNKIAPVSEEENKKINPHGHQIVDVPSKAGDLIIFNFKTNHRATMPKKVKVSEIPREYRKLSIFNAFGVNNESTREYLDYIKSRPQPFYQSLGENRLAETLVKSSAELGFEIY